MKRFLGFLVIFVLFLSLSGVVSAQVKDEGKGRELAKQLIEDPNSVLNLSKNEEKLLNDFLKKAKKIEEELITSSLFTVTNKDTDTLIEQQTEKLKEIWHTLSEDEQLSYIAYLTPVYQEIEHLDNNGNVISARTELINNKKSANIIALDNSEDPIGTMALPNKDGSLFLRVTSKNLYGNELYYYQTTNSYKYNLVQIVDNNPQEGRKITKVGWAYVGRDIERAGYRYDKFYYDRDVIGYFELNLVNTWQRQSVSLYTTIDALGNKTTNGWID